MLSSLLAKEYDTGNNVVIQHSLEYSGHALSSTYDNLELKYWLTVVQIWNSATVASLEPK